MRIAIPVWGSELKVFENGGHAPQFAIYDIEVDGSELVSKQLVEMRSNPKGDVNHSKRCSDRDDADCSKDSHGDEANYQEVQDGVAKPPMNSSNSTNASHGHKHHHHHHSANHAEENRKMGETLRDCNYLLASWVCGRTRAAVKKEGVHVDTFPDVKTAEEMIALFLAKQAA